MRAAPVTFDDGRASYTPGVRSNAHLPDGGARLPAPSAVAEQVINTVVKFATAEPVLVYDRPYSEIIAAARREVQKTEAGIAVIDGAVILLAVVAFIIVAWMLALRLFVRRPPD